MKTNLNKIIIALIVLVQSFIYGQSTNIAPILIATGNQIYCPGNSIKIVTSMNFIDPDDLGIDAVYIQISTGYTFGQDALLLSGIHPTIVSSWNANTGKLSLTGVSGQPTYLDLKSAIEDVEYSNNSINPNGTRTFSISIGQANYLPSNGHYYQYIPSIGITWSAAKSAASTSTYYGIQGYLATITAADESQLCGEQASGAGWIGGSDEQTEGVWKWMTGPEAGTNMVYTFWNTGEPNNLNDEDYAHVTAPGVGITGAWNDLSNAGASSGDYQPKGYIVEYGGTVGDPIIQISTSTQITTAAITSTSAASSCGSGTVTLQATSSTGTINWYANASGGIAIATGTSFTTPVLTNSTTYYVDCPSPTCASGIRTGVTATINEIPSVTVLNSVGICGNSSTTLYATTTSGTINWFSDINSTSAIDFGPDFTIPIINQTTTYYLNAVNNGCSSGPRISVTVVVNPVPIVTDEIEIMCENTSVEIDSGITNVTYLWSTGETTPSINVNNPGIYTVTVTSPAPQNCTALKTITVIEHNIPHIQEVTINETTATINIIGFGDFEYSIDGIHYQDSNVFSVIEGGFYTAFVREKHDCGSDYKPFIIITIPEFFTPNNDGNNDYWIIKGLLYYPNAEVKIFDRYGKLITNLNSIKYSWDGTNNEKLLMSDDYWYSYKIDENSPEIKGHFSMKR